ncbi:MAG: GFA family protein [Myxococcales bacterium]|nr:GFA family protein [Myxococcales bacterium]
MSDKIEGGCLCGAVRFEAKAAPLWVANCHCSMCRRAHGAAYVTWVSVPAQSFMITRGLHNVKDFESSPSALRSFCQRCGSTMFFRAKRWKDEVHIARANIDPPFDAKPQVHAFFSDRADWLDLHDELPKRGGPTGIEPLEE